MLPDAAAPVVFGLLKAAAYTLWCRRGLSLLAASPPGRPWRQAALLAALRLGLGLATAAALQAAAGAPNRLGMPAVLGSPLLGYALLFGAARLAQWRLVAAVIQRGALGGRGRAWSWSAGGTAVSFLTDAVGGLAAAAAVGGIC